MNGTMVACLSCKRVVWAYDAALGDIRGILNMMKMPCRLCGEKGSFDGWRITAQDVKDRLVTNAWELMHVIARDEGYAWANSPNCTWFTEPGVVVSVKALEQQP